MVFVAPFCLNLFILTELMIRLEHNWKSLCCKLNVIVRLRLELGMELQVDWLARCLRHLVGRRVLEGGGTINAHILIWHIMQVWRETCDHGTSSVWRLEFKKRNIMCTCIEAEDDPCAY